MAVVSAIVGAAFTVAVCLALGSLLLRWLGLEFHRLEATLFAFVSGSACLGLAVFVLCVVHQARLGVFLTGGAASIAWAAWKARSTPRRRSLPGMPRVWLALFVVIYAAFFACYLSNAIAPEISPTAAAITSETSPAIFATTGSTGNTTASIRLSGREWRCFFWWRSRFRRHPAAAMVHMVFQGDPAAPHVVLRPEVRFSSGGGVWRAAGLCQSGGGNRRNFGV